MAGATESSERPRGPWVRRLLLPPVYDDPAKTDSARPSHWLALTLMAANILALVALIGVLPELWRRFLALVVAILVVGLAAYALNRTARPQRRPGSSSPDSGWWRCGPRGRPAVSRTQASPAS